MKLSLTKQGKRNIVYEGEYKDTKINGSVVSCFYPKKHSKVRAIHYKVIDANHWDSYANIRDYRKYLYIIYKNDDKPCIKCNGEKYSFHISTYQSIFDLLFELELDIVKKKSNKQIKKKQLRFEIKKLKNKLKSYEKELIQLSKS